MTTEIKNGISTLILFIKKIIPSKLV